VKKPWNELLDMALKAEVETALSEESESAHVEVPPPAPSTDWSMAQLRKLSETEPELSTKLINEKLGIKAGTYKVLTPEEEYEQRLKEELARQRAQREARRILDEELAESSTEIVQRAQPLGTAIFSQPAEIPSLWGTEQRIGWVKGETLMIAAKQGLGKSTLAQNLFLRRIGAVEGDFLEMPVTPAPKGKALYLGMDRPPQIMRSIGRMVTEEQLTLLDERAAFWPGPLPPGLTSNPEALAKWVLEIAPGCHTIVFDSVKDIMPGISKDEVGALINALFQMLLVNGIEVIAVHHQRKGDSDKDKLSSLDDVYGSVHMTNGTGSIFTIDGTPGEARISLRQMKSPLEMIEKFDVLIDFDTGQMRRSDAPLHTVAGVLRDAGDAGTTVKDVALLVHHLHTVAAQNKVRKVLMKMKDREGSARVEKAPSGLGGSVPDRWFYVGEPVIQVDWNAALDAI
jgi:replicative DNA helicase